MSTPVLVEIRDLYSVSIVVESRVLNVRRIHDDLFLADSMMLLWFFKVPSDDIDTPRAVTVCFSLIKSNDGVTYDVDAFRSQFVP